MTERRGSRFLLEALFLVALATAVTVAQLRAIEIAGVMLVGWIVVAALEWAAWRGEPHYGSGLPPRYYVPSVSLPPAQPLDQVAVDGYPDASRDEAPTWIASAALRSEMLGEWPVAAPIVDDDAAPSIVLPPVVLPDVADEPEVELEVVEAVVEERAVVVEAVPEPIEPAPRPALPAGQRLARYSLDPLAEPEPKRRFSRGGRASDAPAVEVPARPTGVRVLPGRAGGE